MYEKRCGDTTNALYFDHTQNFNTPTDGRIISPGERKNTSLRLIMVDEMCELRGVVALHDESE